MTSGIGHCERSEAISTTEDTEPHLRYRVLGIVVEESLSACSHGLVRAARRERGKCTDVSRADVLACGGLLLNIWFVSVLFNTVIFTLFPSAIISPS